LLFVDFPIRKLFAELHSLSASLVVKQVPDTTATGTGEKPRLPVARLASQEFQHPLRVGAGQPLRFRHYVPPSTLNSVQRNLLHLSSLSLWYEFAVYRWRVMRAKKTSHL
jgi:hypothetical protein